MRSAISVLALLAASPAVAEDFLVRADIAEALVYAQDAEVTRRVTLSLPAGSHRILFPSDRVHSGTPPILSAPEGVSVGRTEPISNYLLEEGELASEAEADARAAVEAAEDAVDAARAEVETAAGSVRAAEVQQSYLTSLAGGDSATLPDDPTALPALLDALGSGMARAAAAVQAARAAQAEAQEALDDRARELAEAERALADLRPFGDSVDVWAVNVSAEAETDLTLDITEFVDSGWQPNYEVRLDSETGAMRLDRRIAFWAGGLMPWRDVSVTFSTADPVRQRMPSETYPSLASIHDAQPPRPLPSVQYESGALRDSVAAPRSEAMLEPAVVVEDQTGAPLVEGLSLTYPYLAPVTLGPDGGALLPFGTLEIEAELINRAVPRIDETAFLIADFENATGEPILPGDAMFFRDGDLVGRGGVPFVPQGGEDEWAFGPLDHIRLTWTDLSRDTGDRGVFVSSSTEHRRIELTIENLGAEAETVQLLYATPFSEQEDLEIDVESSVQPDDTAWEDLRGVYAWDLNLAPGQEQDVSLGFRFQWPEGQVLNWYP
ncbi:mucoidy inhibitor MuiA family protein [Rhodobacterales bacterium HKCCE2091]|nr:mucoidy inhibitor MuiA family protein [Rhodobacterales bacterium HKCCE2091]